ncbi:MAG: translation initiation factor IF-2 subunit alpha [Halobacteria archaeon]|nr:translation initiation factor IF-2 subunit alpha [Halobacteria archaeon]
MKYSGWPDKGELVVCKVRDVEDHGAYVDLVEYEDKEGLIHVSEVASGWVKYIRDHVREDQTVVCKVLDIDEESQQIDLSLKDVNDHQKSDKIQEWKNEQKADKWLSMALDDDEVTEVAESLISKHGTVYEALEEGAIHGEDVFEDAGIEPDRAEKLTEIARENINVPYVTVTGYVDVESRSSSGVDDVREALGEIETDGEAEDEDEDAEVEVEYVSAPEYRITAKAHDYKTAERAVEESAQRAIDRIRELGGDGEYHTERRSEA